ncbi:tripartite tricarboxylate transporter substrate binding protein [Pollutimonas bauzanensis]|uniref:Tripartite-type tricarboxylate transporter, receptor component TctC n=1 Tax=Pollutimonas bauzanensis TaxID=658167 RepID=A0A1M5TDM2_9BURK|nr:tripartite tricarboxylate transporter substrate binding protein [Pollutimonas bauzanensis]SHH48832.1 Tripartite-type tricarboxylate transporter, receptor component TctC [Pollutimonas bauzanensis]
MKTPLLSTLIAIPLLALALPAAAQQTRLIIPAPPGGGTDGFFRTVAQAANETLDSTLVVMNVGGAGGSIGMNQMIRSVPDGTTLAAVWSSPVTAIPHTLKKSYGPDDFTPIIQISSAPYVFCVNADFPARTGKGMIEELARNPGKYSYGNDGIGGTGQLASERIFRAKNLSVLGVPFKGAGDTLNNFLGKHVDIYVGSILPIKPHLAAGKVFCPLVSSAARAPSLPDASSLTDIGIPEEETLLWRGILGPKGTPPAIIEKLQAAFTHAARKPEIRKFVEDSGEEVVIRSGPELEKMLRQEYEALGKVAESLGVAKQ